METQDKAHNWWNLLLATGIGILSCAAVFAAVVSLAFIILAYLEKWFGLVGSPGLSWVFAVLLLACVIGLACAFLVERCANTTFTNLTNENITEPSVRSLLIAHVTPLLVLWLQLWVLAPIMCEAFGSFGGGFPWPTDILFQVSYWTRHYWFLTLPCVAALLWGDVRVYLRLLLRGHRLGALIWFWGVFCFLIASIPITLVADFLPIFKIYELISK